MQKPVVLLLFITLFTQVNAQLVEVRADYTSIGDVQFSAYNNSKAPLFLNIDFADLENTTFDETLPYIKQLEPGFNSLFMLQRYLDADVPQFNYQIKVFRSNPMSVVDLDFPYLIPLEPGTEAEVFDVESIAGFWGQEEPESWNVTGFKVRPGQKILAVRNGTVVEVVAQKRSGEPVSWYNTWNNSITVLQPDGTLVCYRNVVDNSQKLKVGDKIYAGQEIGEIVSGAEELLLLIYQQSLNSEDLRFIIPQFVTGGNQQELLLSSKKYVVVHPAEVRGKEMTNKEKRKILR